jgi:hypothetical protein
MVIERAHFKIIETSNKICRVFVGTFTKRKNLKGILEIKTLALVGIPFFKNALCLFFSPMILVGYHIIFKNSF